MIDTDSNFEPKIIGFLCNWCSYAGADLAGVSRSQYPPNVIPIRVMCSGRVDPEFILGALKNGADGVLIAGCHPGDCHYVSGNYKTLKRMVILKNLISQLGVDPRRVRLEWISAAEGGKFVEVITDFVKEIKEIGPTNISSADTDSTEGKVINNGCE
ncbi:MAG: hydrogenase iron-sulfur subunit [Thermoplasmata archaeon]